MITDWKVWDLITAGDGRTWMRDSVQVGDNLCRVWICITEVMEPMSDAEILALGPVRRAVVVTLPDTDAPAVYGMPSRLDRRKVAIRHLADTGATDVWPSDAKRYAAELLAAALHATEGLFR